ALGRGGRRRRDATAASLSPRTTSRTASRPWPRAPRGAIAPPTSSFARSTVSRGSRACGGPAGPASRAVSRQPARLDLDPPSIRATPLIRATPFAASDGLDIRPAIADRPTPRVARSPRPLGAHSPESKSVVVARAVATAPPENL